jgi:hypothetical protein
MDVLTLEEHLANPYGTLDALLVLALACFKMLG